MVNTRSIAELIPRWPPEPSERMQSRVQSVLRSGLWGMTQGSEVEALCRRLAGLHEVSSAVCCANGTIALVLALKAAGVAPGDEVIVPAYTFLATASAPLLIGAIPVFAEVDPTTMLLDPAAVAAAVTKKTRAVIPVHLAGAVADAAEIRRRLDGRNVAIIEDAAQAIGARHAEGSVGKLGDFATLSFQTSKNISSGEGGAVLSSDAEKGRLAWSLHNAGRERGGGWYQHDHVGWNLRMGEMQAVIVDSMLDDFDILQERREQGYQRLAAMAQAEGLPLRPLGGGRTTRHGRHLMLWRIGTARDANAMRDRIVHRLHTLGVHASAGYPCLNRLPAIMREIAALGGTPPAALPQTEAAAAATFWLPQQVLLAGEDAHRAIIDAMMQELG